MAKVITLSRKFPPYHPKAGQPTYFVEQVLNALGIEWDEESYFDLLHDLNKSNEKLSRQDIKDFFFSLGSLEEGETIDFNEKLHTIRANWTNKKTGETYQVWKQDDKASLRVWSDIPYHSPQIIFAPDVVLNQVYDFTITSWGSMWIESAVRALVIPPKLLSGISSTVNELSKNDGLNTQDLLDWFKYPNTFEGQILAWKEVSYV